MWVNSCVITMSERRSSCAALMAAAFAAGEAIDLVAGDIVTFAGDPQGYVVGADLSVGASSTGAVTIEPALKLALAGGAKALGRPIGSVREGARADLLVLDPHAPTLVGREGDGLLDALVFAGNVNPVRDVMVGARWVVREGHHENEEPIFEAYRRTLDTLLSV